jgi:hypothetical protein
VDEGKFNLVYFWAVLGSALIIMLLSWSPIRIAVPEPWVVEWTTWLASWVALGVTARGLWIISKAVERYFDRR